jgi:hypothetical protein
MPLADELVNQKGHDTFGPPVQTRGHTLDQWSNLGYTHSDAGHDAIDVLTRA